MTLMPEIHDALSRAIGARRTSRRSWRIGLLVLGGAIFAGTAVAASTGWHPILGSDRTGHAREARSSVPAGQVAALAVLRRSQNAADRTADVRAVLRFLGPEEIDGIHTDGIRLLSRRPDGVTILVPTERIGRHDRGYPSSIRRDVLCLMVSMQGPPRTSPPARRPTRRPTGYPRGLSAGVTCGTVRDLKTSGIGFSWPSGDDFMSSRLVPDGVARVVVRLRRGRKVTAAVHRNMYEVNTGNSFAPGWGVTWLDGQGRRVEHREANVPG